MKQKTFFFIQPQIVGNAEKWSYSFYPDGFRFWTKEQAIKFGSNWKYL